MKKKFFLRKVSVISCAAICTFFSATLNAQQFQLPTQSVTGIGNQVIRDIAVDGESNQFVGGIFQNTVTFQGPPATPIASAGGDDGYIARYDVNNNLTWVVTISGTGAEGIGGVAVFPDGLDDVVVYATGFFTGSANIVTPAGNVPINSWSGNATDMTYFLLKLNGNGSVAWRTVAGSLTATDADAGNDISVGLVGSNLMIYTTGFFTGTTTFFSGGPNRVVTSAGQRDAFIAQYTEMGVNAVCNWVNAIGSTVIDEGNGIALDNAGFASVTGTFRANANANSVSILPTPLAVNGPDQIFVARYNQTGNVTWALSMGGNGTAPGSTSDVGSCIAVDITGDVYAAGHFRGGAATFSTFAGIASGGSWDFYVVRLQGATGTGVWISRGTSGLADRAYSIAVDNCGQHCYLAADYRGTLNFTTTPATPVPGGLAPYTVPADNDGVLVDYDAATGRPLFRDRVGAAGDADHVRAIALNANDRIYAGCSFLSASCNVGTPSITTLLNTAAGTYDSFHLLFDNSAWPAQAISSTGGYAHTGIATNACDIYASGVFENALDFNGTVINSWPTSKDVYLTRTDRHGNHNMTVQLTFDPTSEFTTDQTSDLAANQFICGGVDDPSLAAFTGFAFPQTSTVGAGFLCKTNSTGTIQWLLYSVDPTSTVGNQSIINSVITDPAGNSYICGNYIGNATLTSSAGSSVVLPASLGGTSDFFLARITPAGVITWAVTGGGGNGWDEANGIAVSSLGAVYVTGKYEAVCNFGGGVTLTSSSFSDAYVAQYTSAGVTVNALSFTLPAGVDRGSDIIARSASEVYFCGYSYTTLFSSIMVRCNMTGATSVTWFRTGANAMGNEVEFANNYVYMSGICFPGASFGAFSPTPGMSGMTVKYRDAAATELCIASFTDPIEDVALFNGAGSSDYGDNLYVDGMRFINRTSVEGCGIATRLIGEQEETTGMENTVPSVNLFPNPFHGSATLQFEGVTDLDIAPATVYVYDMSGRVVLTQNGIRSSQATLDAEQLEPGVYIYRVQQKDAEIGNGKFVIDE